MRFVLVDYISVFACCPTGGDRSISAESGLLFIFEDILIVLFFCFYRLINPVDEPLLTPDILTLEILANFELLLGTSGRGKVVGQILC